MAYLNDTQKNALSHITRLSVVSSEDTMPLDPMTLRNLELTQTIQGQGGKGSLLSILDRTVTAMGGRLLRAMVEQPLISRERIEKRLNAVEAFFGQPVLSEELRQCLAKVYDMERLLSKVSYGSLNPRDCLSLGRSLEQVPEVLSLLSGVGGDALTSVMEALDPLEELTAHLSAAISPEAPLSPLDPGVIREGYNAELDELRSASVKGKQWLLDLETREREETGIKNLRIQYNRVFGYYIEVTKSNYSLVPDRYIRRQTLTNA